jgi:hypothetical protein
MTRVEPWKVCRDKTRGRCRPSMKKKKEQRNRNKKSRAMKIVNQTNYHQMVNGGMARDLIQSQGLPLNKASISL